MLGGRSGDPEWARTTNLQLRRLTLYPIELRGHTKGEYTLSVGGCQWNVCAVDPEPTEATETTIYHESSLIYNDTIRASISRTYLDRSST